jgi:hypothetical protein
MRSRVPAAVGVTTAAVVAALLGASSARADGSLFDALRSDITGSSLPAVQQTSFLKRVALAENFLFPPSPAVPPRRCSATAQLDSIGSSTRGLLAGGQIGADDALTLIQAVTRANDTIVFGSDYPPSPCTVTFLSAGPGGD